MNRNTICFINTSRIWGGGENWQFETILDFKFKIEAISVSNPTSQLYCKMQAEGIRTIPFSTSNYSFLNPFKIFKAYTLLKNLKPHAVMFNTNSDFKLFALPATWARIPFVLYRRDNGKPIKPHFLNKFLLQKCITHFLPCSQFIKNSALSKNPNLVPVNKILVINNSINLSKWDSDAPAAFVPENPDKKFLFGCIGRLSHEKGQELLVEAVRELAKSHSNFLVLIAGNGPLKETLAIKIEEYKLEPFIKLLGFVESNKAFLEAIDCLVIPSYWEGLPTSAVEAMACYKPVIAFDVAGNPEAVIDNETGFLIEPYNISQLALKMRWIIENPDKLKELGNKGRNWAEKNFSRETTNLQLETYFC